MGTATKQARRAHHVLVASGNADFRARVARSLGSSVEKVSEAASGAQALVRLDECDAGILLLDQHLPDLDCSEFLRLVPAQYPDVEVALLDSAGREMLYPDCSAPASPLGAIRRLLEVQELAEDDAPPGSGWIPEPNSAPVETFPGMRGSSPALQQAFRLARLVAPRDTTVLISGETGTGKELVARGIHELSPRCKGPLVVVNCAAIPETLLESELFGYVRGAFTGAEQARLGRIHAAHGGTLFLDEVGELPLSMQAKLLRFLQEGEVQRLGSSDLFRVDVRVVAATNLNLAERVRSGALRQDLYYRLAVFPIELPPLRDSAQHIADLAQHHLSSLCKRANVPPKVIAPAALRLLQRHTWPGNVRELQHAVERAFILSEGEPRLLVEHFSLGPPAPELGEF